MNTVTSRGQLLFLIAMALLVVPEWANIYHSIEEGPAWIASMVLSAVLVTLGYFTWRGARWARMTIIIFISLATLVKVLSFVSGGFNRDAVLALSSVVAGLALLLISPAIDAFLESQRRHHDREKLGHPRSHDNDRPGGP